MSLIKTAKQLELMTTSGHILAQIIREMIEYAKPGITTRQIDELALKLCKSHNVIPGFLGYGNKGNEYPAVSCLSVNDAIVHGIPTDHPLEEGDILGIDMGVLYKGWNSDSAVTIIIGNNAKAEKLISVTRESMMLGIAQARPGNHVGDISHAVQTYVESHGFGVIRDLVGHGIGKELHEDPRIPNFGKPGEGPELKAGMVICIEPMVSVGDWHVVLDRDGWTYRTKDGSLGAHFEHTVAITKSGPIILSQ